MNHAHTSWTVTLVASFAMLAGCGVGGAAPSVKDVTSALETEYRISTDVVKTTGANVQLTELVEVLSVEDCEETREHVYTCTVEAITRNAGITMTDAAKLNFAQTKKGFWRLAR